MALPSTAFVTLSECKKDLGIPDSDTSDDEYIESLIVAAGEAIERWCRRTFIFREYVERLIPQRSRIRLRGRPVIELTSLQDTHADDPIPSTEYYVEDAAAGLIWLKDVPANQGWLERTVTTTWSEKEANLEVTYFAGYKGPNQTVVNTPDLAGLTVEDLPSSIRLAARSLVVDYYSNRGSNPRVKRLHLVDCAVWYDNQFRDDTFSSLLRGYRMVAQ